MHMGDLKYASLMLQIISIQAIPWGFPCNRCGDQGVVSPILSFGTPCWLQLIVVSSLQIVWLATANSLDYLDMC